MVIHNHLGLTKRKSTEVVESLLEIMKGTLENGEDILISGFGKFYVKDKNERRGRNPQTNNAVKIIREKLLMSKAELFKKAGVTNVTINRIEKGMNCRMETRRKIILSLGYKLSDKDKVFPNN